MQKIEKCEQAIMKLERTTKPVMRLIEDLSNDYVLEGSRKADYREILRLFYFGANTVSAVLEQLKWSKTSFYTRRQELVKTAQIYLGL